MRGAGYKAQGSLRFSGLKSVWNTRKPQDFCPYEAISCFENPDNTGVFQKKLPFHSGTRAVHTAFIRCESRSFRQHRTKIVCYDGKSASKSHTKPEGRSLRGVALSIEKARNHGNQSCNFFSLLVYLIVNNGNFESAPFSFENRLKPGNEELS